MSERQDSGVSGWVGRRQAGRTDGADWRTEKTRARKKGRTDKRMERGTDERTENRTYARTYGWWDAWTSGQMGGGADALRDGLNTTPLRVHNQFELFFITLTHK